MASKLRKPPVPTVRPCRMDTRRAFGAAAAVHHPGTGDKVTGFATTLVFRRIQRTRERTSGTTTPGDCGGKKKQNENVEEQAKSSKRPPRQQGTFEDSRVEAKELRHERPTARIKRTRRSEDARTFDQQAQRRTTADKHISSPSHTHSTKRSATSALTQMQALALDSSRHGEILAAADGLSRRHLISFLGFLSRKTTPKISESVRAGVTVGASDEDDKQKYDHVVLRLLRSAVKTKKESSSLTLIGVDEDAVAESKAHTSMEDFSLLAACCARYADELGAEEVSRMGSSVSRPRMTGDDILETSRAQTQETRILEVLSKRLERLNWVAPPRPRRTEDHVSHSLPEDVFSATASAVKGSAKAENEDCFVPTKAWLFSVSRLLHFVATFPQVLDLPMVWDQFASQVCIHDHLRDSAIAQLSVLHALATCYRKVPRFRGHFRISGGFLRNLQEVVLQSMPLFGSRELAQAVADLHYLDLLAPGDVGGKPTETSGPRVRQILHREVHRVLVGVVPGGRRPARRCPLRDSVSLLLTYSKLPGKGGEKGEALATTSTRSSRTGARAKASKTADAATTAKQLLARKVFALNNFRSAGAAGGLSVFDPGTLCELLGVIGGMNRAHFREVTREIGTNGDGERSLLSRLEDHVARAGGRGNAGGRGKQGAEAKKEQLQLEDAVTRTYLAAIEQGRFTTTQLARICWELRNVQSKAVAASNSAAPFLQQKLFLLAAARLVERGRETGNGREEAMNLDGAVAMRLPATLSTAARVLDAISFAKFRGFVEAEFVQMKLFPHQVCPFALARACESFAFAVGTPPAVPGPAIASQVVTRAGSPAPKALVEHLSFLADRIAPALAPADLVAVGEGLSKVSGEQGCWGRVQGSIRRSLREDVEAASEAPGRGRGTYLERRSSAAAARTTSMARSSWTPKLLCRALKLCDAATGESETHLREPAHHLQQQLQAELHHFRDIMSLAEKWFLARKRRFSAADTAVFFRRMEGLGNCVTAMKNAPGCRESGRGGHTGFLPTTASPSTKAQLTRARGGRRSGGLLKSNHEDSLHEMSCATQTHSSVVGGNRNSLDRQKYLKIFSAKARDELKGGEHDGGSELAVLSSAGLLQSADDCQLVADVFREQICGRPLFGDSSQRSGSSNTSILTRLKAMCDIAHVFAQHDAASHAVFGAIIRQLEEFARRSCARGTSHSAEVSSTPGLLDDLSKLFYATTKLGYFSSPRPEPDGPEPHPQLPEDARVLLLTLFRQQFVRDNAVGADGKGCAGYLAAGSNAVVSVASLLRMYVAAAVHGALAGGLDNPNKPSNSVALAWQLMGDCEAAMGGSEKRGIATKNAVYTRSIAFARALRMAFEAGRGEREGPVEEAIGSSADDEEDDPMRHLTAHERPVYRALKKFVADLNQRAVAANASSKAAETSASCSGSEQLYRCFEFDMEENNKVGVRGADGHAGSAVKRPRCSRVKQFKLYDGAFSVRLALEVRHHAGAPDTQGQARAPSTCVIIDALGPRDVLHAVASNTVKRDNNTSEPQKGGTDVVKPFSRARQNALRTLGYELVEINTSSEATPWIHARNDRERVELLKRVVDRTRIKAK